VQVAFRVSPERRQEIKIWVAQNKTSAQDLLERGLDLVLKADQTKPPKNAPKKRGSTETTLAYNLKVPHYREWVDFVVDIFNSGNSKDIHSLIGNIDAFKRGDEFDKLAPVLAHMLKLLEQLLKKEGATPDATLTSALTQAADLSRTLARARTTLQHAQAGDQGTRDPRPKRAG
jgi:hypothetical protein